MVPKCKKKEMCHMTCFCIHITPPEGTLEKCDHLSCQTRLKFKTLLYQRLLCIMKVRIINDALFSSMCGLLADVYVCVLFTWFRGLKKKEEIGFPA